MIFKWWIFDDNQWHLMECSVLVVRFIQRKLNRILKETAGSPKKCTLDIAQLFNKWLLRGIWKALWSAERISTTVRCIVCILHVSRCINTLCAVWLFVQKLWYFLREIFLVGHPVVTMVYDWCRQMDQRQRTWNMKINQAGYLTAVAATEPDWYTNRSDYLNLQVFLTTFKLCLKWIRGNY